MTTSTYRGIRRQFRVNQTERIRHKQSIDRIVGVQGSEDITMNSHWETNSNAIGTVRRNLGSTRWQHLKDRIATRIRKKKDVRPPDISTQSHRTNQLLALMQCFRGPSEKEEHLDSLSSTLLRDPKRQQTIHRCRVSQ